LCYIQVNTASKRQFTKDDINMEVLYSTSIIKLCSKFQDLQNYSNTLICRYSKVPY